MAPAKKRKKSKPGMWRTLLGIEIPVIEMADSHLANAIAMLKRQVAEIEAEYIEHEDWEEGERDHNLKSVLRIEAKIAMLSAEQDRRIGLARYLTAIENMIRIELEGPHIGARIV